jgi:hypothetical protein
MERPLIYLEFKTNQIPYVNGFDSETVRDYLLNQNDPRGYYGLFNDFDNVFRKTSVVPKTEKFYYPVIVSLIKTAEVLDKINIPDLVVEKIKDGKCKILITCPYEGWDWDVWDTFVDKIKFKYNFENLHFVMFTGNYLPNSKYRSITFNFWESSSFHYVCNDFRHQLGILNLKKDRQYKFLCLNRRPAPHRYGIVSMLYDYKSQGILTCAQGAGYNKDYTDYQIKQFKENLPELIRKFDNEIVLNLPLKYDDGIDPETQNPAQDDSHEKFYNSYLYVVTETFFFEQNNLFLSEKIFKPISFFQPFVVIGRPGTLKLLKDLGYKTFSDYWDESYDDEPHDAKRLHKAARIIRSIIKKSNTELTEMLVDMESIFVHNFNVLQQRSTNCFSEIRVQLIRELGENGMF